MLKEELKEIKSTRHDIEQFGFVVGGIFVLIGAWFAWSKHHPWQPFTAFGFFLVLGGAFFPSVLRPLQRAWMMLSVLLGWFMTRVILSVLFFAILTPVALIARLVGSKFLDLEFRPKENLKTYWRRRIAGVSSKRRLEQQF